MKAQSLLLHYLVRHGGVPIAIGMRVETREGEGSEFIVMLPVG